MIAEQSVARVDRGSREETLLLVGIAAIIAVVHLLTNGRYGFHRDELQVLSDARHLDWGFVPYPPLTPFVERIGLSIFGLSMVGPPEWSVPNAYRGILVSPVSPPNAEHARLSGVTGKHFATRSDGATNSRSCVAFASPGIAFTRGKRAG